MAKTVKVIDIHEGERIICIKNLEDKCNPYRIYVMPDRYHRRLLIKYADFMSVIYFIEQYYRWGIDTYTVSEKLEWVKKRIL